MEGTWKSSTSIGLKAFAGDVAVLLVMSPMDATITGEVRSHAVVISASKSFSYPNYLSSVAELYARRMGKALPDKIYKERTASRMGLDLARGPDPRSYNPGQAMIADMGRSMFGLDS